MESRYLKYDRRKLPGQRRSTPKNWAYAEHDDQTGKYFKCKNCGFTCNSDRDQTGNGAGYSVTDAITPVYSIAEGSLRAATLSLSISQDISLIEKDSAGDPKIFKRNFDTHVTSGCPFCGSKNWK